MAGRGRPRKVVGGPDAAPPAPRDHNAMSDDQEQKLTRDHAARRQLLLKAETDAKAARLKFDKVIKADLGEFGLANIKLLEKLESDKGEDEIKADLDRRAKVARWAGLQVGTQGSLFEDDRRTMNEKAYAEGKRDGLKGADPKSPYSGEAGQEYMRGWHDGQAITLSGIKKTKPEAEIVTPKGNGKKSAPDEFDQAANGGAGGEAETATKTDGANDTPKVEGEGEQKWPDDEQVAAKTGDEAQQL